MKSTRRQVLLATSLVPLSLLLDRPDAAATVTGWPVGFLPDRSAATRVGRAFLKKNPMSAVEVADALGLGLDDNGSMPGGLSAEEVARRAATMVREDFENERVVSVNGWILSRTEALICALQAHSVN